MKTRSRRSVVPRRAGKLSRRISSPEAGSFDGTRVRPGRSVILLGLGAIVIAFLAVGCGAEGAVEAGADKTTSALSAGQTAASMPPSSLSAATQAALDPVETSSSLPEASSEVKAVFDRVATALDPLPVYGPTILPMGSETPEEWWPVLGAENLEQYTGPRAPNPHIDTANGRPISAQVIVEVPTADGAGWLVFLQNFRGDLGDAKGEPLDRVAGREAELFRVQGGALVQWSDSGCWYGLFARGLALAVVVDVASGIGEILGVAP